jgi:hypothetical protein
VVIAHHPALVEKADIVLRVDKGRVVEISRRAPAPAEPQVTNPSLSRT